MSRSRNYIILNRQNLNQLGQAGLSSLAAGPQNIHTARRLALWRQRSGAEIYLLVLLITASRHLAQAFFVARGFAPGEDRLILSETNYPLTELKTAYREFLYCYPRPDLEIATEPGMSEQKTLARQHLLADIFILETLIENPALQPYRDLFDDTKLTQRFDYHALIASITNLFRPRPDETLGQDSLPQLLRSPLHAAPHDLVAQISYIEEHWLPWLPEGFIEEVRLARAVRAEEAHQHLPGPGPTPMPIFGTGDGSDAPAAFTADIDWMPNAVLLAKSVYVWLNQLSDLYQCSITTLAEIPEEELARLANRGFNAIWLIGIWERSSASRTIKRLCGNPEAQASAYALHAYRIADDLGGEEALDELEQRCHRHGIRLACDVVPNHTGIDSEWVANHPDWFLQSEQTPYPAYRFTGPDLSPTEGMSIRIEDGYWDHSDAAVVCEHLDHRTGQRRYIYHGNDGTHMPWNDTAQLNFLLPEVRRAMSDLIISVAQRFSLIRFDAAMTLARKHYRRLWFPPPGGGAGVPSRSSFCLTDEEFDQAFPVEFWREVVDRINQEAPDTLLIAEAFWLMESYFVRNLGMHRVYNSAFMNMLKREENTKYRKILKETLAYNPEILKRYVNFMNNPDEATAVEQFGKGDKYFGVATLLATLPGLPMFGHGQVEGYREKYGMEYRRAYWEEQPDPGFTAHHEHQVFPLLRQRRHFADVEHFSLYDFLTTAGINDDVYAFSNGPPGGKVLIVFNNAPQQTTGRVHLAAPQACAEEEGVARAMPSLFTELGLASASGQFCRFRDIQGSEQLLHIDQMRNGLELTLGAYEHRALLDFQVFEDTDGSWQELHHQLQGQPTANLDHALLRLHYQPLWLSFTGLFDPERLHVLAGGLSTAPLSAPVSDLCRELRQERDKFTIALRTYDDNLVDTAEPDSFELLHDFLPGWLRTLATAKMPDKLLGDLWHGTRTRAGLGVVLLSWALLRSLGRKLGCHDDRAALALLRRFGLDLAWQEQTAVQGKESHFTLTMILLQTSPTTNHPGLDEAAFIELCNNPHLSALLGINHHAGMTWFAKEGMTDLVGALALQAIFLQRLAARFDEKDSSAAEILRQRLARAAAVGYRLDKFLHLG